MKDDHTQGARRVNPVMTDEIHEFHLITSSRKEWDGGKYDRCKVS